MKKIDCNRKYYTYELIDERSGKPFYVGTGSKHRMYEHEQEARQVFMSGKYDLMTHKQKRIIEILEDHGEIGYNIIHCTRSQEEAYSVEAARIKEIGLYRLTNERYGHQDDPGDSEEYDFGDDSDPD